MISFEHRILSEYRIKIAKIETLAKTVTTHQKPRSEEAKGASEFLDVLIDETDRYYENNADILSSNGKKPHNRSRLTGTKEWSENIEKFYERNPRRRPRK